MFALDQHFDADDWLRRARAAGVAVTLVDGAVVLRRPRGAEALAVCDELGCNAAARAVATALGREP